MLWAAAWMWLPTHVRRADAPGRLRRPARGRLRARRRPGFGRLRANRSAAPDGMRTRPRRAGGGRRRSRGRSSRGRGASAPAAKLTAADRPRGSTPRSRRTRPARSGTSRRSATTGTTAHAGCTRGRSRCRSAGGLQPVLGVRELGLQGQEVLVRLQIRVGLGDREQLAQRGHERTLGGGLRRGASGRPGRRRAGAGDLLEDLSSWVA